MASFVVHRRQQRRKAAFEPQRLSDAAKIATGKIATPPSWMGRLLPPAGYQFNTRATILANCQIYAASYGKPMYHTVDDNGLTFKYICKRCSKGGLEISGKRITEDICDDTGNLVCKCTRNVAPFTVVSSTTCDCEEFPVPFMFYMNGGGKRE